MVTREDVVQERDFPGASASSIAELPGVYGPSAD
jgi:hypothetical protein